MSSNVVNQVPYVRSQREFPREMPQLTEEIDLMYVDMASALNARSIGIYPVGTAAITGNRWYIGGNKNQTIRRSYSFTSTSTITHRINFNDVVGFVYGSGWYTDGTSWYGLNGGSSTAVTGQITFYIDSTSINFVVDGAAPSLTQGYITVEWLTNI